MCMNIINMQKTNYFQILIYAVDSGAGKSTLTNVLTQRNLRGLKVDGEVLLNGVPLQKITALSKFIGYIQQHDVLPRALTVKEYLYFNVSHSRIYSHFFNA